MYKNPSEKGTGELNKRQATEKELLEGYRKLNRQGREHITQLLDMALRVYTGPVIVFPKWQRLIEEDEATHRKENT